MRFVFDLDGVISELKSPGQEYSEVKPVKKTVEIMQNLKKQGHYIIITTSRNMNTMDSNLGKVMKNVGKVTLEWLEENNVPYDEIYFGKAFGDVYIDDMALGHSNNGIESMIDSKLINIVIPMAGRCERFRKAGYEKPKFMLEVDGKSLLEWALESLPLDMAKNIFFIILKEDDEKYHASSFVKQLIENRFASAVKNSRIVTIKGFTEGQADTVMRIKDEIDNDRVLLIFNNDSSFSSPKLRQHLLTLKARGIDGIIGTFRDDDPKWSFVDTDSSGLVCRTAEKVPISDMASTGLYVFSKGSDFVRYFSKRLDNKIKEKGEYYVIPIYNDMIHDKKRIIADISESFLCFGTPQDIENYRKGV